MVILGWKFVINIYPSTHPSVHPVSWAEVRLTMSPVSTSDDRWWWTGTVGTMRITRGNRSTRRNPSPVSVFSPPIPQDLARALTRVAAVGSRRLTAWAMTRPSIYLLLLATLYATFILKYVKENMSPILRRTSCVPFCAVNPIFPWKYMIEVSKWCGCDDVTQQHPLY
jgi:hypothetical protein